MPTYNFTVITSKQPLGKRIALAADGSVTKAAQAFLTNGVAEVHAARSIREFMATRSKLAPHQALMFGTPLGWPAKDAFRVLAQGMAPSANEPLPVITRTRQHVGWAASAGLLMIDYDPPKGSAVLARDDLYAAFVKALPALAEAPVAWAPSGSSCISNKEGAEVIGVSGQRLYVAVDDAARIAELGSLLFDRLALAGHAHIAVDKAGRMHRRGIMDTSTMQPERLDFVAATCGPGLVQKRHGFMVWSEDAPPLATAAVLEAHALTDAEQRELAALWRRKEQDEMPNATRVRAEWAGANAVKRLSSAGKEVTPEAVEEIAARLRNWTDGEPLDDEHPLHLNDGRTIAVADLRQNPEAFRGVKMHDPLEPEYRADSRIAFFYESKRGQWLVYSQAHHGQRFVVIGGTAEEDFGNLDDDDIVRPPRSRALAIQAPRTVTPVKGTTQRIKAELPAVIDALLRPDICGKHVGLDRFTHREMLAETGEELPQWRDIKDTDETWLRDHLQRRHGYGAIPTDTMRHALSAVAELNAFDSAQTWLGRLTWDGVPRIEQSLSRYFGAEDTAYTRGLGRYIWTGLAGRVEEPGVKADIVPIAVGIQGARKSTTVAAMVPDKRFYCELDLSHRDDDTARLLQGRLVMELPELRGLRAKDAESLKAFVSQQTDRWVEKWKTRPTEAPRRGLFFGTTNEDAFLSDPTGSRRWAPFRTGQCDPEAMAADRDQLWAEGAAAFRANGVEFREVERLARAEHAAYVVHDALEEAIAAHLARLWEGYERLPDDDLKGPPPDFITTNALWAGVHGEHSRLPSQTDQNRVAAAMRRIGWAPRRKMVEGVQLRGWEPAAIAA